MNRGACLGLALVTILPWLATGRAAAQGYRVLDTAMPNSVPMGVAYQGRLERAGAPFNGPISMRFVLYDSLLGGATVYDSGDMMIQVAQGIFGVSMDIPASSLVGVGGKYLEITVDRTYVLQPRDPLLSVPYAKVAETVEGVIDISTGGLTIQNSGGTALYVSSATGRVGIGTTSPNTRLTVSSTVAGGVATGLELVNPAAGAGTGQRLIFNLDPASGPQVHALVEAARENDVNEAAYMSFHTRAGVMPGERVRIDGSGNVGIGTSSPGATLEVQAADSPGIILNHGSNPQFQLRQGGNPVLSLNYHDAAGYLGTVSVSTMTLGAAGVEAIRIKPGGEVGIGNTDPQHKLDVGGALRTSGILETQLAGTEATPALTIGDGNSNTGFFAPAAGTLALTVGGSERVRVDASGNVGIGVTTTQGKRMWISGGDVVLGSPSPLNLAKGDPLKDDLFVQGNVVIEGQNITAGASRFEQLGVAADVDPAQEFFKVGAGYITVLTSGRVGIGTVNPQSTLEIVSPDAVTPAVVINHPTNPSIQLWRAGGGVARLEYEANAANVARFGTVDATSSLGLFVNSSISPHAVTILANGRVGISSAAPGALLGVQGDANISGSLALGIPLPVAYGGTGANNIYDVLGVDGAQTKLNLLDRSGSNIVASSTWNININGLSYSATELFVLPQACGSGEWPKGVLKNGNATGCVNPADAAKGAIQSQVYNSTVDFGVSWLQKPWTVMTREPYFIDFASQSLHIEPQAGTTYYFVGISTGLPQYRLDVNGDINANGKLRENGAPVVPTGMIMFFKTPCVGPAWINFTEGQGRYIVGLVPGWPALAQVGNPLSFSEENREAGTHTHGFTTNSGGDHTHSLTLNNTGPHTHAISITSGEGGHAHGLTIAADGNHSHSVTDSGHTHGVEGASNAENGANRSVPGSGPGTQSGSANSNIAVVDAPNHSHAGSSISGTGTHDHTGSADNTGSTHTHTGTADLGGTHTHTGTTNSGPAGGVAGTNAPYVQLYVCQKT